MSEMVERVARALCLSKMNGPSYPEGFRERRVEQNWHLFTDQARIAIEAMKEPTEAMLKVEMDLGGYGFGDGECDSADPREIWTAMCKEALK